MDGIDTISNKVKPIGNRLLVRLQSTERKTESGIILADQAKQVILVQAEILALGDGEDLAKLNLEVGQTVLVNKHASSSEVDRYDKDVRILVHTDPLGVIEDE